MSSEDQEEKMKPCVICLEENEQMLMLSCVHDPCINCAALHYNQSQLVGSKFYKCPVCSLKTELDTSSIVELQNMFTRLKVPSVRIQGKKRYNYKQSISTNYTKSHSHQFEGIESPNMLQHRKESEHIVKDYSQPKQRHTSKEFNEDLSYKTSTAKRIQTAVCVQHPQDQLTYYCFTCYKLICPECAIHGSHHQHEVQASKRAVKEIRNNLMEFKDQLGVKLTGINKEKQNSKMSLREQIDRVKRYHQEIKTKFSYLKTLLLEKEKEVLKSIDANHEKNSAAIRQQVGQVDSIIEQYQEVRKDIDGLIRKDDLSILQEYSQMEEFVKEIVDKQAVTEATAKNLSGCSFRTMFETMDQIRAMMQGLEIGYQQFN